MSRSALLRSCYAESLAVADALGAESIAFPLISAGIFRWPVDDAVRQALDVLRAARPANLREARLILFGRASFETAVKVKESNAGTD